MDKCKKTLDNGVEVVDYVGHAESVIDWICKEITRQEKEKRRPKVKA